MKNFLPILIGIILVVVIGTIIVLSGKQSGIQTQNKKLQVVASFYPIYFFSSQIGGDHAEVTNITPAGAEPHDYDPRAQDIAKIESGQMLVLNGGVEPWADKTITNLKGSKVKVITAAEGLLNRQIEEEGEVIRDPHVWLDPLLAKTEVNRITKGYIDIDPNNSTYYLANVKLLDNKLDLLNKKYKLGLANCEQKDIITSHAAFGYLAARYGLTQVPITGISPDAEPSVKALAEIADFAKKNNVKYIFFESLISPKLSQTVASEIGAKTLVLDPIEGISDNDIKQGKNYFSVMETNLKNLQIALVCH